MSPRPRTPLLRLLARERVRFVLTNRIPRRWATLAVGWFSRIESRRLTRMSISIWRRFADDLDLSEAKDADFRSLHACFTRELKDGARAIDPAPDVVTSPCDAIVGAHGRVDGTRVFQAKGFPYSIEELIPDPELAARHRDGWFVTLRLKSSMYHRLHAPLDCEVRRVDYVSGDTFNVDPITVRRIERLFCRNERAVVPLETGASRPAITLVPVAAILVAGIRLHCLPDVLDLRHRGPNRFACEAAYAKGQEMGYFQHGSTVIVFAAGPVRLAPGVREGRRIRVGEPLLLDLSREAAPRPSATATTDLQGDDRFVSSTRSDWETP